jgi:hypothetical protein
MHYRINAELGVHGFDAVHLHRLLLFKSAATAYTTSPIALAAEAIRRVRITQRIPTSTRMA